MSTAEIPLKPHSLVEDVMAIVIGATIAALGVIVLKTDALATGGTAGLAFLVYYKTGWNLGAVVFAVNLPFYAFAVKTLGWRFTIKTFVAVAILSGEAAYAPYFIKIGELQPVYAAIVGGLLVGVGLLILIRHKASLGGVGILAVYLQNRLGLSAGKFQMGVDVVIVAAALLIMSPSAVALSVLGAVALNLVIAMNHLPGRYNGI
ncbi:MAG: YitT family protein [Ancalomicrobiaceae bacterium]|nr:YitT family protein [Ancalomicrobiaceae bacterium]